MLIVLGAGIIASTAAAAIMYDPWSDPSRVYYGTDTRALAPLLGAALAIAVRPWRHRAGCPAGPGIGLDALGIMACCRSPSSPRFCATPTTRSTAAASSSSPRSARSSSASPGIPGTALGEMLGTQPLRWLGERSYAIYLWHWPVCVLTRPGMDIPLTGWANAALRIAITIVLAELSYRLIETPIRRNGFIAPFKARARPGRPSRAGARPRRPGHAPRRPGSSRRPSRPAPFRPPDPRHDHRRVCGRHPALGRLGHARGRPGRRRSRGHAGPVAELPPAAVAHGATGAGGDRVVPARAAKAASPRTRPRCDQAQSRMAAEIRPTPVSSSRAGHAVSTRAAMSFLLACSVRSSASMRRARSASCWRVTAGQLVAGGRVGQGEQEST